MRREERGEARGARHAARGARREARGARALRAARRSSSEVVELRGGFDSNGCTCPRHLLLAAPPLRRTLYHPFLCEARQRRAQPRAYLG